MRIQKKFFENPQNSLARVVRVRRVEGKIINVRGNQAKGKIPEEGIMKAIKIMVIFGDQHDSAARKLARAAGYVIATATLDGKSVHAGNAYKANGFRVDEGDLTNVEKVIVFECSPAVAGDLEVIAVCNHLNLGVSGYGSVPEKFLPASSVGQLIKIITSTMGEIVWKTIGWTAYIADAIGRNDIYFRFFEPENVWMVGFDLIDPLLWDSSFMWEVPQEIVFAAAGDHCPADAYAGRCPGVDPKKFLEFRVRQKVAFYANYPELPSKTAEEIFADIESAKRRLCLAMTVSGVRDLQTRGMHDSEELREAAFMVREAYNVSLLDTDKNGNPTNNLRIILSGHISPKIYRWFMEFGNSLQNRAGDVHSLGRGVYSVVMKSL